MFRLCGYSDSIGRPFGGLQELRVLADIPDALGTDFEHDRSCIRSCGLR